MGDGGRLEAGPARERLAGSTPAPSAVAGSGAGFRRQTVNLFVSGSIPLGHLQTRGFASGAVEDGFGNGGALRPDR